MPTAIDRPMEQGGWRCLACGQVIPVECTKGLYKGNVFEVVSYRCPCGHSWKNPEKARESAKGWNPYRLHFSQLNPFAWGHGR